MWGRWNRWGKTASWVDLITQDNETWSDAWQFWPPGTTVNGSYVSGGPYAPVSNPSDYTDYSWNFSGATGTIGVTGPFANWNFTSQNFRLDIKTSIRATGAAVSFTGAQGVSTGSIVVQDPVNRILQMNVPESAWTGVLVPGEYIYELMMYDNSNPPVRTPLMHGKFTLVHGITGG